MYNLTLSELAEPSGPEGTPAIIRAARSPDSRVLTALLNIESPEKSPSTFLEAQTAGYYDSALLSAIKANFPVNVSLLLSWGADPNGLPLFCFSDYSVRFIRFRHPRYSNSFFYTVPPRKTVLAKIQLSQCAPLTEKEIESRRASRARFWAEVDFPTVEPADEAITALEAAAKIGNIEILQKMLDAGPDISGWTSRYSATPSELSVSYLATSTPLHRAIEAKNQEVVDYLLKQGFSADVFPLATITCCTNPVMAAITTLNLDAYRLLRPYADLSLRTPIYDVHILHFAAAMLSLSTIQELCKHTPLQSAQKTALGHTLLHIACLPLDDTYINHFSLCCHQSIHEFRTLDRTTTNRNLWPHPIPGQLNQVAAMYDHFPSMPSTEYFSTQQEVALFLCETGVVDFAAQDIHGNTALHYLAGHRLVNMALVHALRKWGSGDGERVWVDSRNMWGYTPQNLFEEGAKVKNTESKYMPFWRDPMGRWRGEKWIDDYNKVAASAAAGEEI